MLFLSRLIAIIILVAILFFPAKALWGYISEHYNFQLPSKKAQVAKSEETSLKLPTQKVVLSKPKPVKVAKKQASPKPVVANKQSFHNPIVTVIDYLSGRFPLPEETGQNNSAMFLSQVALNASRDLIGEVDRLGLNFADPTDYPKTYTISEGGSTPAEYTLARIQSPDSRLIYELNSVNVCGNGQAMKVHWKIKNLTGREIYFDSDLRAKLNPTKLKISDFIHQRMFPVLWNRQIPLANCMVSQTITPFGRIECSAIVGPLFQSNQGLRDNVVLIHMPGNTEPVRVVLNV